MTTPVGAVQAQNAHKGVKRSVLGNPVGVPTQLPGFRGRAVDAGGPIKTPKLRNGNLNNETSNVILPRPPALLPRATRHALTLCLPANRSAFPIIASVPLRCCHLTKGALDQET